MEEPVGFTAGGHHGPSIHSAGALHPNRRSQSKMIIRRTTGAAIATAAALLFSTAAITTASAEDAQVQCTGVNACKGHSACKTANSACKGQNACKGQGFLMMSDKECKKAQEEAKKAKM
jgi:hypothetical protein